MGYLLAFLRLIIFVILAITFMTFGVLTIPIKLIDRIWLQRVLRAWSNTILPFIGVKFEIEGEWPNEDVLYIPNHRSYIDLLALTPFCYVTFVAKASVKRWPIVGQGASLVGTVWVDRKSKTSRVKTRKEMKRRLEEGYSVVVFPEGTTTKGPGIAELRPGMFYVAANGDIPVVPMAIEYKHQSDAWIGEDTFIPHFFRCFSKWKTPVKLRLHHPIRNSDAEALRAEVGAWLTTNLLEMRQEWDAAK